MGSAASSRVKGITIEQSNSVENLPENRKPIELTDGRLTKTWADDAEEKIKNLEWKVAEVESKNLDLHDQIQALEEQLNSIQAKTLIQQSSSLECSETVRLKDAKIEKLEKETKAVQDEIHNLRVRYRKKLKAAKTKLATARQETALRMFELKGEITKLSEEKNDIQNDLKTLETGNLVKSEEMQQSKNIPDSSAGDAEDSRTQIILQLSQQISEQNDKIFKLEQELSEKKASRPSSKTVNNSVTLSDTRERDKFVGKSIEDAGTDETLSELKAIASEMQALKLRKKQKNGQRVNSTSSENRRLSSISRDSGLVSRENSCQQNTRTGSSRVNSGRMLSGRSNASVVSGSDISVSTPDSQCERIGSSKTITSIGSDVSDLEFDGVELLEDFIVPNAASLKLLKEMDKRRITPVEINSPRIKVK